MDRRALASRSSRLAQSCLGLVPALLLVACGGDAGSSDAAGEAGRLRFHGEQMALPGFAHDTGLLPDGSPVQVRLQLEARGQLTADAEAVATGSLELPEVTGVTGSGGFALDARILVRLELKVDLGPLQFDGPLMGVPDIEIAFGGAETFTPFLIGGSAPLEVAVPDTQVAAIPLQAAAGIPGTLYLNASGTVSSAFRGVCAGVASGSVQYLAETETSGTLILRPRVEIEVPLAGTMSFGPFELPAVPIPPITAGMDLGSARVTAVGTAPGGGSSATPAPCGAMVSDGGPASDVGTGDGPLPDTATTDAPAGDGGNPDGGGADTDGSTGQDSMPADLPPLCQAFQDGCSTDQDCCTGLVCRVGLCQPAGCSSDADCPFGFTCQASSCEPDSSSLWDLAIVSAVVPATNPGGDSWDPFGNTPDPFVEVVVVPGTPSEMTGRTETVSDTFMPTYNQLVLFQVPAADLRTQVRFTLRDDDSGAKLGDDDIGACQVALTAADFDEQPHTVDCGNGASIVYRLNGR